MAPDGLYCASIVVRWSCTASTKLTVASIQGIAAAGPPSAKSGVPSHTSAATSPLNASLHNDDDVGGSTSSQLGSKDALALEHGAQVLLVARRHGVLVERRLLRPVVERLVRAAVVAANGRVELVVR